MANFSLASLAQLLNPENGIDPSASAFAQLANRLGNQQQEPMAAEYGGWVQANPGVMGNATQDVGAAIAGALSQYAQLKQRDRMKAERQNITSKDQIDPRDLINAEDPELRGIGGKMLASKALTQQEKQDLQDQNLGTPIKILKDGKLQYAQARRYGPLQETGFEAPVELHDTRLGDSVYTRPRMGGVTGYEQTQPIAPTPENPEFNAEQGVVVDPNQLYQSTPHGQSLQQNRQRTPQPVPPQGGFGTLPNGVPRQMPERNILLPNGRVDPQAAYREWEKLTNHESGGRQSAVSNQGAIGIGQIIPETAKGLGIDPKDPLQNVQGSQKLWLQLLEQAGGDVELARRMYHGGPNPKNWGPKNKAYVTKVEGTPGYAGDNMPNGAETSVPTPDSPLGQMNQTPGITKVAPSKQEKATAVESEDLLAKHAQYMKDLNRLAALNEEIEWDIDVPGGRGNLARMAKDYGQRNFGGKENAPRNEFKRLSEAVVGPNLKAMTGGGQIAIPEQLMARLGMGLATEMDKGTKRNALKDKIAAAKELEALLRARAGVAPTGPAPTGPAPAAAPSTLDELLKQHGF